MSNKDTCEINLNLPVSGKFREGDTVSGHVKLAITEEIKYKELLVELTGYAAVCWNDHDIETGSKDFEQLKGKNIEKHRFFYDEITVQCKGKTKGSKDLVLTPGEYTFPFVSKLPVDVPASIECHRGCIRYEAVALLKRSSKSNKVAKQVFYVENGLDLNFIPESGAKMELCKFRELGSSCFRSNGSVTVDWVVDKSGFAPGEEILISGSVQNDSRELIACSRVALVMVVTLQGKKKKAQERQEVASARKGETRPNEVTVWQDALLVPPLLPTDLGRVQLVSVTYELEFKVIMEGMAPIVFTKDVYIGTVPINRAHMQSCSSGMYTRPGISASAGSNELGGSPSNHEGLSLADLVTAVSSHQSPVVCPSAPSDDATLSPHYNHLQSPYAPPPPSAPDWHTGTEVPYPVPQQAPWNPAFPPPSMLSA